MSKLGYIFSSGHDRSFFNITGIFDEEQLNQMLIWASKQKASDITMQTDKAVTAKIGGRNEVITLRVISNAEIKSLISHIYSESGVARLNGGNDIDTAYTVKIDRDSYIRFRINVTSGLQDNDKAFQISIRTLSDTPPKLADLEIEKDILENFRPNNGMVLITGPTGSGKSTLLASFIRDLLEKDSNEKIISYSSPIEHVFDNVKIHKSNNIFLSEIPEHLTPSKDESLYSKAISNALRRNPSIIVIGEARDRETIQAAITASSTGHLLYSTLHTIGVIETFRRITLAFPESDRQGIAIDFLSSIRMIITQLLVNKIGGGQIACREYLLFSEELKNQLLAKETDLWDQILKKEFRNNISQSMKNSAEKLLNQNIISEDTFNYISNRDKNERL